MSDEAPSSTNVLITGTRKGIGRFLAERFLETGARVFGCSRSETDLVSERYRHFSCDVTDEASVKSMFVEVAKQGGVDILVNNAGLASMNHFVLTPKTSVETLLNTNLVATFTCSREAAKQMQRKKCGRIVNFTTVAVALSLEGEAAYVASKAGVEALTRVTARELAPFGITVNAIGPTPVETDLIKAVPKEKIEKLVNAQAIKRLGTPDDIWNVVRFLVSPSSSFVTGQILYLGGV